MTNFPVGKHLPFPTHILLFTPRLVGKLESEMSVWEQANETSTSEIQAWQETESH